VDPADFKPSYETFLNLIHPRDREAVEAVYKASIKKKEPYHIKHRLLMDGDRVKYVYERGENHFNAQGEMIGSTGTVQDITESKLLEMENEKKQKMLFQQSKMAQMGEMLGNIAHQWRQPLSHINSVVLDIDMAYEQKKLTKAYLAEKLDKIEELTTYMSDTISGFQNYFDPRKTKERFSSCEAVGTAIKLFETGLAHKSINMVFHDSEKYEIYGHKKEFVQVLLVLFNNAKDAFYESRPPEPTIEIRCRSAEGRLIMKIKDNGGGIEEGNLQRIFEPYFSTKEEDGRGVGLYMAKMIVENRMGGEIDVQSSAGHTVFTILV
jgi:C4-dicarboxylate-specific signal transduction histidine kinase